MANTSTAAPPEVQSGDALFPDGAGESGGSSLVQELQQTRSGGFDEPPVERQEQQGQPRNDKGQFVKAEQNRQATESEPQNDTQNAAQNTTQSTDFTPEELQEFAEAEGLTLATDADRQFAERMFKHVLSSSAPAIPASPTPEGAAAAAPHDDRLTELERSFLNLAPKGASNAGSAASSPAAPPAPAVQAPPSPPSSGAAPAAAAPPQPMQYPVFEDIGREWKSPMDGQAALYAEYGRMADERAFVEGQGRSYTPDFSRLQQIQEALYARDFAQNRLPVIGQVFKQIIESAVIPGLRQEVEGRLTAIAPLMRYHQEQQVSQARESALSQLASTKQYAGIYEAFEQQRSADGKALPQLEFVNPADGQKMKVANTLMNQMFIAHPEILNYTVEADPERGISEEQAYQLTMIGRYRLGMDFLAARRLQPEAAQQIAKEARTAGAKQASRQVIERVRQRLNGSTVNGAANGSGANGQPESFVSQLNRNGGVAAGRSFTSL